LRIFPPYLYFRCSRYRLFLASYKYFLAIFVAIFLKCIQTIFVKFSAFVETNGRPNLQKTAGCLQSPIVSKLERTEGVPVNQLTVGRRIGNWVRGVECACSLQNDLCCVGWSVKLYSLTLAYFYFRFLKSRLFLALPEPITSRSSALQASPPYFARPYTHRLSPFTPPQKKKNHLKFRLRPSALAICLFWPLSTKPPLRC